MRSRIHLSRLVEGPSATRARTPWGWHDGAARPVFGVERAARRCAGPSLSRRLGCRVATARVATVLHGGGRATRFSRPPVGAPHPRDVRPSDAIARASGEASLARWAAKATQRRLRATMLRADRRDGREWIPDYALLARAFATPRLWTARHHRLTPRLDAWPTRCSQRRRPASMWHRVLDLRAAMGRSLPPTWSTCPSSMQSTAPSPRSQPRTPAELDRRAQRTSISSGSQGRSHDTRATASCSSRQMRLPRADAAASTPRTRSARPMGSHSRFVPDAALAGATPWASR